MATGLQQDPGSSLFSPQALQLLQNVIGGTSDTDTNQSGATTNNQNVSGATTTATTGQTQGNTQQTTQQNADISALQQVFQQQQGGITPEMLAAIFTEGSKAAPGLVNATANAVGARSSGNTPLATALSNLSSQLTGQAATMSQNMRNASADTAARIAELTKSSTTTGNTNQTNTQNTDQANAQNTTQAGTSTSNTNQQTDTNPNYANAAKLIALLAGGSALGGAGGISNLFSGLGLGGGNGGAGGGLMGLLTQGGNGLLNLLGLGGPQNSPNTPTETGNMNNSNILPGEGQQLSQQQLDDFLSQYNNQGGGLSGAGLDEFLASLESGVGGDVPVSGNENWWSDEGWDQIDWGSLVGG
jgi:hypothetical protein